MERIVFITNSVSFGGVSKSLCFIAESLSARGHKVCIVNCRSTNNVTNYERTLDEKIEIYSLKKTRRISQIIEIYKVAKAFKASLIVGFTNNPSMFASIVGFMLHIPSIMSERADPSRINAKHRIKRLVQRIIINCSTGGVFQTEGAKLFYGKGLQKRSVIIPNPIFVNDDIPKVTQVERRKTVVSVGRLDNEQKRYDVLLDAFALFSKTHPEYVLKLYGRGVDEDEIRKWVEEKKLTDKVLFMGLTTRPMADIAYDGIFIIASDYEGISNSLLEAMAVGLPCVSTDHTPGGARLLIKDHENGLLAPIGDAVKLSKALCEFADDPALAKKCGDNARDVVLRFSPSRIISMWDDYVHKLCSHKL